VYITYIFVFSSHALGDATHEKGPHLSAVVKRERVRVIRNLALRQFFTRCLPDQKNITSFPAVCTKNNRSENECAEKASIRLILANFQTGAASVPTKKLFDHLQSANDNTFERKEK
jgi:hypothetical protein